MTTEIATATATIVDYKKFYDVETYLLNEVGPLSGRQALWTQRIFT
jgi:hypothetical protein